MDGNEETREVMGTKSHPSEVKGVEVDREGEENGTFELQNLM